MNSPASHGNVFYPDDRVVEVTPSEPWSYIGKLVRTDSTKYCTAALVGSRRTVWTAAHCLWDFDRGAPHSHRFHFIASDSGDRVLVATYTLGTRTRRAIYYDGKDWAVLHLARDAKASGFFLLPNRIASSAYTPQLLFGAYGEDRAGGRYLLTQKRCQITGALDGRGMITHNCDTWFGSSGAPLFARENDRFQILFLNTSQRSGPLRLTTYVQRYANVSIPISQDIIDATKRILGDGGR